jgi:glutamate decarboxylase
VIHKIKKRNALPPTEDVMVPTYSRLGLSLKPPRYEFEEKGMLPDTAYNIIHDELILDGNSRVNLATFVSTWMEPEAKVLMTETFDKNMIDKDEYPQTAEIEMRCVNMLANLWHAPESEDAVGTSTIGSSEACMLGGMAMKWKWRERMKKFGKATDKPNMIMGANVQVCWEKFCRYWDIEPREVPVEGDRFMMNAEEMVKRCDQNTIGVVGILGTTFTGEYEPIEEMNNALEELNKKTGWEIGLHIDAASGGLVAPFLQPHLKWDFRLKWVKSINVSGHKYGLVYPGVGWIVWRSKEDLPEDLIFKVNYLGGDMPTFAINFSRPGNQVIAQYYNFIRLGKEGYTRVQKTSQEVALFLSSEIGKLEPFEIIAKGDDLPVVAWKIKEDAHVSFSLFDFVDRLRMNGWLIPAYTMPKNREDLAIARIVVKHAFSKDLAQELLNDMKQHLEYFAQQDGLKPGKRPKSFHHT